MLNLIDRMYLTMKVRWNAFVNQEQGDVNIVSIIVICGIVVILAAVFKEQLKTFITTVFSKVTTNAGNVVDGGP